MELVLRSFYLLLPALVPSWRFFDVISASPRIEYALLNGPNGEALHWRSFRPRAQSVGFLKMLRRLFWNPRWNETLYLVSLSERVINDASRHAQEEILARLRRDLAGGVLSDFYIQYRIVLVTGAGADQSRDIAYTSLIAPLRKGAAP